MSKASEDFPLPETPATTLDLDVFHLQGAEGLDEGFGQTDVGHQRNVMVDGTTADAVTIGELAVGVILRNVDDEVELVSLNHIHHVVGGILVGPCYGRCLHAVLLEELCGLQQGNLTLNGT